MCNDRSLYAAEQSPSRHLVNSSRGVGKKGWEKACILTVKKVALISEASLS